MCTKSMELNHVLKELQTCREDTVIFRKLINFALSCKQPWDKEHLEHWHPVFEYIMNVFIPNADVGRERALLASHTFFALLSKEPTLVFLKNTFTHFLNSTCNKVCVFDKTYDIIEKDLFKLICSHGYLQVNRNEIYSNDICTLIFDVVFEHCIKYTKHSYFAYKLLYMWLQRSISTNLWDSCPEIEHKLETIIFSNWCNAINEISKQNSTLIFNMYLKIMERKYCGYLEYLFKHCVDTISWQNELKYDILAEICNVWDKRTFMTSNDFLLPLCTSLTKYYLRSASTKVYFAIVKKLNENQWIGAFGNILNILFHRWESTTNENHSALQFLCKHWLEPVVKKYKTILLYLWDLVKDIKQQFLRSHFQRIGCEMRIELPEQTKLDCYINHRNDIVRLNGFIINCYQVVNLYSKNRDQFLTIRSFLWHNANSAKVSMRDGIVKYFKVFYANILKLCESKAECIDDVYYITHWLHEFLLDCMEIGSCYQRKILGLNLYNAILSFTSGRTMNKSNNIENISCMLLVEKHLKSTKNWEFINKKSLFILLRLVLDSALDIKQIATSIILNYFDKNVLSEREKHILFHAALKNCNSSKFYEIESGAALMSILAIWLPLNVLHKDFFSCNKKEDTGIDNYSSYSDFLLNEASNQLMKMKEDTLKAIVQNEPYYGVMTALLNIAFRSGPEECYTTPEFIEKTLCLLEDAVEFFLCIFSSKSHSKEYSSSFAEMGLAIAEAIKNSEIDNINFDDLSLTPAHQVFVSCIWMSLKVSCEVACEIGTLMYSDEAVKRSVNIIITVLFRCRHKGVVEAAGAAMGHLTRYLCKESKYSDLLKIHILRILENDSMNSLNITRRGAGLSIMFHRIVVNDSRRDKPLLHFAVEKLLDLLDNFSYSCLENTESQHDSPWARRLHFLRTLVADKEIHAQLTPYMENISLICFKYLECEIWTIRNASLQLFGSIVPRLVGQSYGDSLDFGGGYSINHFITHYPILADYILEELHKFSFAFTKFSTALYLHSNIVHILILLSKCSYSACNLIDYSSQKYVAKTKALLRMLFENPVLYVRLLAAKAYAALTDVLEINFEIERLKHDVCLCRNVNLMHSYLLTMKYLNEKLSVEIVRIDFRSNMKECLKSKLRQQSAELLRYRKILKNWTRVSERESNPQICYVLEALFLESEESVFEQISDEDMFLFDEYMSIFSSEKIKPGFFQFINLSTKLYAKNMKHINETNISILYKILDSKYPCPEQSISFLKYVPHNALIMKIVVECLFLNKNYHELLLKAMVNYVLNTLKQCSFLDIQKLEIGKMIENSPIERIEDKKYSDLWNLWCILIILYSQNEIMINEILTHALQLSVHREEHMRLIAVEFMQFSAYRFTELSNQNKLSMLHCSLILLKDEISEIREAIAANLRTHVLKENITDCEYSIIEHDEYIYQKLLSDIILGKLKFPTNKDMNMFFIKLFTNSVKDVNRNVTIENPFYHEDIPFYREESKFLNMCFYYIKQNKHSQDKCHISDNSIKYDNENDRATLTKIETRYQLEKECFLDDTNLEDVLNTKYVDYLLKKQKVVIQEYC